MADAPQMIDRSALPMFTAVGARERAKLRDAAHKLSAGLTSRIPHGVIRCSNSHRTGEGEKC